MESGRLYDGVTELPVIPTVYNNLSNGQKLYYIGINYAPFSRNGSSLRKSTMEFYQDHSGVPTSGKATERSLADIVGFSLPRLASEPSC